MSEQAKGKKTLQIYMNHFDDLNKQFVSSSDYMNTQNDILYLQKDKAHKFLNIDPTKVNEKKSLMSRKLVYNQLDDRNRNSYYSTLKIIFVILSLICIVLLIIKFRK